MKTHLKFFLTLLSLLFLASCGTPKSQTRSLEISQGFIVDSNGFNGGLIVYGEGPNGARFSVSNSIGSTINVVLADGVWNIRLIGWENSVGYMFEGGLGTKRLCGSSSINFDSSTTSATISVSETNCATSDLNVKEVMILSCGGLYQYNSTLNQYSSTITSDNFCSSLPKELQSEFKFYRIYPLNVRPGVALTRGQPSLCQILDPNAAQRLFLPTQKIPLGIKIYKNLTDCTNQTAAHFNYDFANGLAVGNPTSFDSQLSIASNLGRLVVPSTFTRRAKSPFMAEIPRILCGTSVGLADCLPDPTGANIKDFNVPFESFMFSGGNDGQSVIRSIPSTISEASACSTLNNAVSNSRYFDTSNCRVEDGILAANFNRNQLTCQKSGRLSDVVDVYERDGKIYTLHQSGGGDYLKIFSRRGTLLQELPLGGTYAWDRIAVSPNGSVYVANIDSSPQIIDIYAYDTVYDRVDNNSSTITVNTANNYSSLENFTEMEIIGSSGSQYLVAGFTGSIKKFNLPLDPSPGSSVTAIDSASISYTVKKLLYRDNSVWILSSDGTDSKLYTVDESSITGTLSSYSAVADNLTGFHVETLNSQKLIYTLRADGELKIGSYSGGVLSNIKTDSVIGSSSWGRLAVKDKRIYYIVDSMKYLSPYIVDDANGIVETTDTVTSQLNPTQGVCTENISMTIGSTNYSFQFTSQQNQTAYTVFDTLLRYVGIRNLSDSKSFTFFRSLAHPHGGDSVNAGGELSDPQEMLGPSGPGGIFYEYATCNDLLAAVEAKTTSPKRIEKTISLTNPFNGNNLETYTIKAVKPNSPIPLDDFNCQSALGTSCASPAINYDLVITWFSHNEPDKGEMRIKCGQKVGSLESYESENSIRRRLLIWRTNTSTAELPNMRFEIYSSDVDSMTRAQIMRLVKNGNDTFLFRKVDYEVSSGWHRASIEELERNSTKFITGYLSIPDLPTASFNASNTNAYAFPFGPTQINQAITNDTFSGYTSPIGMTSNNTNVLATNSQAAFTSTAASMSKGSALTMSPIDVKANVDNNGPLLTNGSIFKIP